MKVGDLVKENWGMDRTGVIIAEVSRTLSPPTRLFKVLWNRQSPVDSTLIGPAWESQVEVISESRS